MGANQLANSVQGWGESLNSRSKSSHDQYEDIKKKVEKIEEFDVKVLP